jgi:hypothetical protein
MSRVIIGLSSNQPTKELTKGGDLRETQVDVPLSEQPFLHFNASPASKTDTLLYNWDSLTLTVYSPDSRPGLGTLKATALGAHRLPIWGGNLWLDSCLGVEPRVTNHVMYSKWALWWSRRARGEGDFADHARTFFNFTLAFALQLRKITVKPQSGWPKCAQVYLKCSQKFCFKLCLQS